jgi:hypothetical protein
MPSTYILLVGIEYSVLYRLVLAIVLEYAGYPMPNFLGFRILLG